MQESPAAKRTGVEGHCITFVEHIAPHGAVRLCEQILDSYSGEKSRENRSPRRDMISAPSVKLPVRMQLFAM